MHVGDFGMFCSYTFLRSILIQVNLYEVAICQSGPDDQLESDFLALGLSLRTWLTDPLCRVGKQSQAPYRFIICKVAKKLNLQSAKNLFKIFIKNVLEILRLKHHIGIGQQWMPT